MRPEKILVTAGLILAAVLALKYIKQLFFLSFTLLSLKVVWMALIILFIFVSLKKRIRAGLKNNLEEE